MKPATVRLSYHIEFPPLQPTDPVETDAGTHVLYVYLEDGTEVVGTVISRTPVAFGPVAEEKEEFDDVIALALMEAKTLAESRGYTILEEP